MSAVNVVDRDSLFDYLVAINGDKLLRDTGQERCRQTSDFLPLARGGHELYRDCRSQKLPGREPERSSRMKVTPPEVPITGDSGRGESECDCIGKLAEFGIEVGFDCLELFGARFADRPIPSC